MRRNNCDTGYVSVYEFDMENAKKLLSIRKFSEANEEWLEFIVNNRSGKVDENRIDLNIGPVADDNIYRTIRLFETGAYDANYTVKKLKTEVLHDQWALHTNEALSFLKFKESIIIK